MSKYCPILDHNVVYLTCQECEEKCSTPITALRNINTTFYCLITGSRTFTNYELLKIKMDQLLCNQKDVCIVSGGANGADMLAERYAKEKNYELKVFPADWELFGKQAGLIRNKQMHQFIADHKYKGCVCFWDGASKGTVQNFDLAKEFNTDIRIIRF